MKKAQVFATLCLAIGSFMLASSAFAKDEYKDVAPDKSVGTGANSLRVKILDPVTQQAWANKPYRVIVYETPEKAIAVMLGNTDSQGYTATLKTAKPATDFIARPRMQSGEFPFISQLKIMESFDGKGIAHAQYIHFFGDGSVFTGISDERGDTAEIGSNKASELKTQIKRFDTLKDVCDWQASASLLNQTVDSKPAQKIELIKQVLSQTKRIKTGKDDCSSLTQLYGDHLMSQLMNAALAGGPDLLNASAAMIVDMKTERLIADDLANDMPTKTKHTAAELRLKAMLELLNEASAVDAVSPDFFKQWVDKTVAGFNGLDKANRFDDEGVFIKLAESAVWRKDYAAAEKLVKPAIALFKLSGDKTGLARPLAVQAMIAKSKGDIAGAQTLFEDANNWLAGSEEEDVLAAYRAEFKDVPFGKMRISVAMLKDAQQWCPKASESRDGIVEMFSMEEQNVDAASRILTLDALMTHGTAKAGKITLARTCKTVPTTFELSEKDIAQIRAALMLGGIMVIGDKNDENYNAPRTQLALLAWLQSVKLAPGYYEANKIKEKLNFGFEAGFIFDKACHRAMRR
jgi:hypothetical protein